MDDAFLEKKFWANFLWRTSNISYNLLEVVPKRRTKTRSEPITKKKWLIFSNKFEIIQKGIGTVEKSKIYGKTA